MTEYHIINVSTEHAVSTITLSNPARRNAIGPLMVNELLWALEAAASDANVRVVVLTGEGKAFCAGGDFSQMPLVGAGGADKGDYADLLLAFANFPKPTIARVNGSAMGGGLGLVASCTLAISVDTAEFATPEINVGLFPMMIMAVLARNVPKKRLNEMVLLGERFGAQEALTVGLLSRVVAATELDSTVQTFAAKLIAKSPLTTRLGLAAVRAQEDLAFVDALPFLRARLAECLATEDASEGLMAFLEKRPPVWKGK